MKMKQILIAAVTVAIFSQTMCIGANGISAKKIKPRTESVSADWLPYIDRQPVGYWDCTGVLYTAENNSLTMTDHDKGVQYHLLAQSVAGLTAKALGEGRSKVVVWLGNREKERNGYLHSRTGLEALGIKDLGEMNAIDLATKTLPKESDVKHFFSGYVLIDAVGNPESTIVGPTASHVYDAIIVDVRDKAIFDKAGYKMVYDARKKTTADAWTEFKDYCSNQALVLIPVQHGELRDLAIANRLFTVNINPEYRSSAKGNNEKLLAEILDWLQPNAAVYGWDRGIDENKVANSIAVHGCQAVPFDWGYNTPLTSLMYPLRQNFAGIKGIDPRKIDYDSDKRFVSFYLSDGDNVQWMMLGFQDWYAHPESVPYNMTYGVAIGNTAMVGPSNLQWLIEHKPAEVSIFERSSYYFVDTYATLRNKDKDVLKKLAQLQAEQMRRHGAKLLGLVSRHDSGTPECLEAYRLFIEANDELEGIIVAPYSPYADGEGRTWWFKNSKGWDIPVVNTKYSVWNLPNGNHKTEGSPVYIAGLMQAETGEMARFSSLLIHAWSKFYDRGPVCGPMDESSPKGLDPHADPSTLPTVYSAGAARLTMSHLDDRYRTCNMQELFWRMRMAHNPQQTREILEKIK
ncbi:hypothetical protein FACS1894159_00620 [Bacteroidia bacterium]|nr:hypothetical protein FACS1894159_00620 [Bacteroidia bacterium]